MTVLVIAEHDHATVKPATLNTVTAGIACQSGDVHVLVAGANAAEAAAAAAKIRAASGATSEGLRTTLLPASRAGTTLVTICWIGKFHGTIAPTTPIGSRTTSEFATSSVHANSSATVR